MHSDSAHQRLAHKRSLVELVAAMRKYVPQDFSVLDARDGQVLLAGEIIGDDAFRAVLVQDTANEKQVRVVSVNGPIVCLLIPLDMAGHRDAVAVGMFSTRALGPDDDLESTAEYLLTDPKTFVSWIQRQPPFLTDALMCLGRLVQDMLATDLRVAQLDSQVVSLGRKIGESYEEISLLYRMFDNVRDLVDVDELARFVLDWAIELLPAEQAVVQIFERGTGKATEHATLLSMGQNHLDSDSFGSLIDSIDPDTEGRPLVINAESTQAGSWAYPAVREMIIVPLGADQYNAGWLAVINHADGGWLGTHQARLLGAAATVMGMRVMMNDLRELRQAAESANSIKDRILANLSHELRTPLNGILGFSRLLLDGIGEDGIGEDGIGEDGVEHREGLETIQESAERLSQVVDDFFEMQKLDSHGIHVPRVECRADEIILGVVTKLRHRAADKGLTLEATSVADAASTIHSDPQRLTQLLTILVHNSIKFTESGGICIESMLIPADDGHRFQIKVLDTGVGIPDDKLEAIFDPFVQGDVSPTRTHNGLGLGLAICQRIAKSLGIALTASNCLGGGSQFTLEFRQELFESSDLDPDDEPTAAADLLAAVETNGTGMAPA